MISWFLPVNLLALLMLLVCQSVQYRLSSNTVMAKGCGRPTEEDFRISDLELAGTPTAASLNRTGFKGNIHQSKQSQLLGLTDFYSTKKCRMYSLKFMWGYKSKLTKKRSNAAFGLLQQCSANILPFSTAVLADVILSPLRAAFSYAASHQPVAGFVFVKVAGAEMLHWIS